MARPILAVVVVLIVFTAQETPAQAPVTIGATVQARAIRLDITGPPRAGFAVLVSAAARGGFFHGYRIDVEYLHPLENFLGGGELDEEGRAALEVPRRRADLRQVGEAYLQAVVFGLTEPRRVLGVSGTLRFRAGPPPVIESWRPSPWRAWVVLLVPLVCLVIGVRGRRRGVDLRARFAPAAALLVAATLVTWPGWSRFTPAAVIGHGLDQSRVDARVLGDRLAGALAAVTPFASSADAIQVRLPSGGPPVPPRVLQYHLYPLRLLTDAASIAARQRGDAVLWLTGTGDRPPPGAGFFPVAGFAAPDFQLYRAAERRRP